MGPSFFTAESLIADGPGFAFFGREHIVALCLCLVSMNGLVRAYMEAEPGNGLSERRRMLLTVAAAMALMRLSHDALCAAAGSFGPSWWPLHLCNLCELLCMAYALCPSKLLGQVVFGLALPSGALALVFPGWAYCPLFTWASFCGFAEHAAMVAFALSLVVSGEVAVTVHQAWAPLVVLALYLAAVYPLNHALGTNFAFVNWPIAGTPLVALAESFGNPGYLVPYAAIMALLVVGEFWLAGLVMGRPEGPNDNR